MDTFPFIETGRLTLGALSHEDVPQIVVYANNRKIAERTLNLPHPYSEKDALFWINMAYQGFKNNTNLIFAIRLRSTGEFIGGIGLTIEERFFRAELGYWLAEPYWNQGFATEALSAVIHFAFNDLHLNKLTASWFKTNPASGRVMDKCGMKKEGELKQHVFKNAVFHDLVVYGLIRSEYSALPFTS